MIFQVVYLSNKSRRCDARVKVTIFTKVPLRRPNVFKVILGTINTYVFILLNFIWLKLFYNYDS
jgi:hypothetical protein